MGISNGIAHDSSSSKHHDRLNRPDFAATLKEDDREASARNLGYWNLQNVKLENRETQMTQNSSIPCIQVSQDSVGPKCLVLH